MQIHYRQMLFIDIQIEIIVLRSKDDYIKCNSPKQLNKLFFDGIKFIKHRSAETNLG